MGLSVSVSVPRRVRRTSVALLVVGLHLMGLVAWWTTGRHLQATQSTVASAPITVWLPALPLLLTELAKPRPAPHADQSDRANTAQSAPAPTAAAATAIEVAPQPLSVGVAPDAPASTLNLTLSRQAMAPLVAPSFAEQSPFHGPLPVTVERLIAGAAAESGPWTEERVDDDHFRLRRGTTCIMLERPRAAILDPMNDASRRMPWRASTSKC